MSAQTMPTSSHLRLLGFEPIAWPSLAGRLGTGLGIAAATAMLDEGTR